ncbi:MAG: hypothetical protein GX300_07635 [Tissierellia bacterium]|nr:hypothetical protein [Tissierellia bacterium]
MESILRKGLVALLPEYIDLKGNCTIIFGRDTKKIIVEKSIKAVIKSIAKYYMLDLNEAKKRYKPLVSSSNLIPIPLTKSDVFIPIKTRRPMYKNDGAFGYVNIKYIKEVKSKKDHTYIYLNNGLIIEALCNLSTVEKHLRNGHIISRCYEERGIVAEDEEKYKSLIPATKADISMILSEMKKQLG